MDTPVGLLPWHKCVPFTQASKDYKSLPALNVSLPLWYLIEVFVDGYIALAMATGHDQLYHVSMLVMGGMHSVFPPAKDNDNNPHFLKKINKRRGAGHGEGEPGIFLQWLLVRAHHLDSRCKT